MTQKSDIVVFQGDGFIFQVLGRLLKLFNTWWDRWGWHTAIIWRRGYQGWFLLEATAHGVMEHFYSDAYLHDHARIYRWLDTCPNQKSMDSFFETHILRPYDVAIYFWTALQYLVRHFFNHRIPRLLDARFTCWELCFEFAEEMGKQIGSKYDCPMITEMIKAFEEVHVDTVL